MRRIAGFMAAVLVFGVTTILVGSTAALAATCTGTSTSGAGSVVVPSGQTCTLSGVTINASVTVQSGARLSLVNSVVVGTVSATQPADIDLSSSFSRGLVITGSVPGAGTFSICGSTFAGGVGITSVAAPVAYGGSGCTPNRACGPLTARNNVGNLSVQGNLVGGSGQVTGNSALSTFTGNKFGGDLSATGNSPSNGSGNTTQDPSAVGLQCPQPAPATYECPAQDNAGFALVAHNANTVLFCSYPVFPTEDPNDFFCTYNPTSGVLIEDHDAGLCPSTAVLV